MAALASPRSRRKYLASIAQDDEHLALLRAFDPTSMMVLPLTARERCLGTLSLGSSRGSRRRGQRDLAFVERLASRIALAADNARLDDVLQASVR